MDNNEKIVAYVILVVEEYNVLDELKKLNGVTEARVVYGEYDIIVRMEVDSIKMLEKLVMNIRRIKGVLRSVTLISA